MSCLVMLLRMAKVPPATSKASKTMTIHNSFVSFADAVVFLLPLLSLLPICSPCDRRAILVFPDPVCL